LYQRGLIQEAVIMLKNKSNLRLLAEWIKLIGKICINPAIQKKLMDLQIHEAIANICEDTSD
jgi:enhancing lycopene biosynthesis protein 2